jgi:hypothetical protein
VIRPGLAGLREMITVRIFNYDPVDRRRRKRNSAHFAY